MSNELGEPASIDPDLPLALLASLALVALLWSLCSLWLVTSPLLPLKLGWWCGENQSPRWCRQSSLLD